MKTIITRSRTNIIARFDGEHTPWLGFGARSMLLLVTCAVSVPLLATTFISRDGSLGSSVMVLTTLDSKGPV